MSAQERCEHEWKQRGFKAGYYACDRCSSTYRGDALLAPTAGPVAASYLQTRSGIEISALAD